MDITTIHTAIADLQAKLEAVEVFRQNVNLHVWGDGINAIRFEMEYSNVPEYGKGYETFRRSLTHDEINWGADVNEWFVTVFRDAHAWIDTIPTAEERAHQAFTASLGRLIDQGRDIGIEVDFLNPLTAMMEKLATNALEDKRNK
jgi:hypothetical protein